MSKTVAKYMRTPVRAVAAGDSVVELERLLTAEGISGVPVVEGNQLVGVVSRSDIVRRMAVEQSKAELVSDFYRDPGWAGQGSSGDAADEIGAMAGEQLQRLHVRDIMSAHLISCGPGDSLQSAAALLLEHSIHRVVVLDGGQLVGILSTQDLVRAVADG